MESGFNSEKINQLITINEIDLKYAESHGEA